MSQTDQQNQYTNEELHKMSAAMAEDLRMLKAQLDREREEKKKMEDVLKEREGEFASLRSAVEKVKDEKKQVYGDIIQKDIKPWMQDMKKRVGDDSRLVESIDTIDKTLEAGLENAFMDKKEESLLRFVESVASAEKVTSSTLEKLLKTEQEWGQKYEELMKQKEEIEKQAQEKTKELEESTTVKEKLLEDLRKELEELRSKANLNVNNTEAHFETPEADRAAEMKSEIMASTPMVTATASKNKGKFESIFDFRPQRQNDWRALYLQ